MQTPTVDIIVPVWNSLFETRACLASVLQYSNDARLIVVDNGSSRETELMLEEFSEPIAEHGLFMKSERNLGILTAINMGLARSDSDFAVILCPHVQVTANWLSGLIQVAQTENVGIVSPVFRGIGAPVMPDVPPGDEMMETFQTSFSTLLLRKDMRNQIGNFDEGMDGGEWCLKDYLRRALKWGFHSCVTSRSRVVCGKETVFGSELRRLQQSHISSVTYRERWGGIRHYCVYFGRDALSGSLSSAIETILHGARQGHRFTLLLHNSQASNFRKNGWQKRHTSIEMRRISLFSSQRDLRKQFTKLQIAASDIIPVRGWEGVDFPGVNTAIPFSELAVAIGSSGVA